MNVYSWGIFAVLGAAAITGYVLLLMLYARQSRQMQALQAQLNVFVDSSISVAQSVDQLMRIGAKQDQSLVASRRWVIQEAKTRLMKGEQLMDIAAPLGLSKDEVRLLNTQLH